jgi:hypothetical protein
MKKIFWILALLIWIISLIVLIIAVTNLVPDNSLKEYRLVFGLIFICISGLIGFAYKKLYK